MADQTVYWPGYNGRRITFHLYDPSRTTFNAVPGVYIVCKQAPNGDWHAIYVGECESFNERLANGLASHHRLQCMQQHGGTHVCTLVVSGSRQTRLDLETELRSTLNPPCNRQ
jgi:hypothetical protein